MALISKNVLALAAGLCGSIFIGYCIYFDHKRHKDPDFKKKLRERRRQKAESMKSKRPANFPDIRDHEAVQRFFLKEVQLGEELLANGDLENGVDHLANAISVCGQPDELLQVLQQTLQPQVFHLLVQRLPAVAPMMLRQGNRQLQEEDVE